MLTEISRGTGACLSGATTRQNCGFCQRPILRIEQLANTEPPEFSNDQAVARECGLFTRSCTSMNGRSVHDEFMSTAGALLDIKRSSIGSRQ